MVVDELKSPLCMPAAGNIKVGKVWTFSLPSVLTCPGASAWCRAHCYAKRIERLRPHCLRAYMKNMVLSMEPERFVEHVLEALPNNAGHVRVHVGGDFYSKEYVESWIEVCKARPHTKFWSYTRSWNVKPLLPIMEQLRALPNIQLWASVDPDMPMPPAGWRTSFIDGDPRAIGITCRHQAGTAKSCVECRHCFRKADGDVVFKVH